MLGQAIGRSFGILFRGADDITGWLTAAAAFFALGHTFRHGELVRVGIWLDYMGPRARWAAEESSFADMKAMIPKTMGACFSLIEQKMFKGPWVMGEQYTICDPYLYTLSTWLEGDSVDINATPKIADHFKRMSDRPAVRKVMDAQKA